MTPFEKHIVFSSEVNTLDRDNKVQIFDTLYF